jgi:hypothetical protein
MPWKERDMKNLRLETVFSEQSLILVGAHSETHGKSFIRQLQTAD